MAANIWLFKKKMCLYFYNKATNIKILSIVSLFEWYYLFLRKFQIKDRICYSVVILLNFKLINWNIANIKKRTEDRSTKDPNFDKFPPLVSRVSYT